MIQQWKGSSILFIYSKLTSYSRRNCRLWKRQQIKKWKKITGHTRKIPLRTKITDRGPMKVNRMKRADGVKEKSQMMKISPQKVQSPQREMVSFWSLNILGFSLTCTISTHFQLRAPQIRLGNFEGVAFLRWRQREEALSLQYLWEGVQVSTIPAKTQDNPFTSVVFVFIQFNSIQQIKTENK